MLPTMTQLDEEQLSKLKFERDLSRQNVVMESVSRAVSPLNFHIR